MVEWSPAIVCSSPSFGVILQVWPRFLRSLRQIVISPGLYKFPGQSFSRTGVKIILAYLEMSHCLQAADAYLDLVKVKWSSSSQKEVLGWVFSLMGDSFILFGSGEPNNIADIFIYVRWDFGQTIMDQLAYRKVGKVVALLGLLLESDRQTVKKRNLTGS